MNRELASNDRLVRERWPLLFWANRSTLIGAAASLLAVIALRVFEAILPLRASDRSEVDGFVGPAYVLTAVLGLGFMLTGYLRLFMVHRIPGHVPQSKRVARPIGSLVLRLTGATVLFAAVATGWLHWGLGSVILFLVVFAVVYLPLLWR
jgi:hypothetical protein